jgi:hypothetical protein
MRSFPLPLLILSAAGWGVVLCAQNTSTQSVQEQARKASPFKSTPFQPKCDHPSYPSPAPKASLGIDAQCGLTGSGGDEANQNSAKNNFCASGDPTDMSIDDFANLQQQVNDDTSIPFGNSSEGGRTKGPAVDRAPLQAFGEGKLVRLQGFVIMARQENAESVNCESNVADAPLFHDIHIEIGATPDADKCSGIVVEMVPHHRPDTWTAANVDAISRAKLPVRVTGQLLFDSSHFPCRNGSVAGGNPERVSLWEIHPVYVFEVCPKGDCSGDTGWIPLNQYTSAKHQR